MRAILLAVMFVLISCKEKSINKGNKFTTKTGKTITVDVTHPVGESLATIEIRAIQFGNGNHFILKDVDPISKITLGDLDNNGFDELYIFTKSVGSGTYGNVIGYGSNRDKSMSPIYFPEINEKELSTDGLFRGYMGHDVFTLQKDRLVRKFPIYKEGDSNSKPTRGTKTISYIFKKGEASWQLKPIRTYNSEVVVVKNCTGTYIQYKGQDYKVCNQEMLADFKNQTKIHITFRDSKLCEISKDIAMCAMYHPFVSAVEIIKID